MLEKLCSLLCGGERAEDTAQALREVLDGRGVGIVSARCCAPLAAAQDERLEANLAEALKTSGRDGGYRVISITDAQKTLPRIARDLRPAEQRLVAQIQSLVNTEGFAVFPILVIGGKVAYYGGLPTPEMIERKLAPVGVAA